MPDRGTTPPYARIRAIAGMRCELSFVRYLVCNGVAQSFHCCFCPSMADNARPLPIAESLRQGARKKHSPAFGPSARLVGAGNLTASSRASCSKFSVIADFAHWSAPPLARPPRLSHEPRAPHEPTT